MAWTKEDKYNYFRRMELFKRAFEYGLDIDKYSKWLGFTLVSPLKT